MEEGMVLDTTPRRGLRDHRGGDHGPEFLQSDLEGLGSAMNLWKMGWCKLGLGRMAHDIPFNLQHYDPDTSCRTHTPNGKIPSLAVRETEMAVPIPIRPCSSSRFRGFSL